jgi:two-component system, chemotaxis family, sensor kinase CheA
VSNAFDPSILQDFLTESGELLTALESELVTLEATPGDPDLINKVFRALHTIKGSASFLALTNLVEIAHCAESALNAARGGQAKITHAMMDLLLEAVDLIKTQMAQLQAGDPLAKGRRELIEELAAIGEGRQNDASDETHAPAPTAAITVTPAHAAPAALAANAVPTAPAPASSAPAEAQNVRPLVLGAGKADLVEFLIADLDESLKKITELLPQLQAGAATASASLSEQGDQLGRSVDFFELPSMLRLTSLIQQSGEAWAKMSAIARGQLVPRLGAAIWVLSQQSAALRQKQIREFPIETLADRIDSLTNTGLVDESASLPPNATLYDALALDGVSTATPSATRDAAQAVAKTETATNAHTASPAPAAAVAEVKPTEAAKTPDGEHGKKTTVENTIRVEVSRLESLMNLVGELVLQKNRVAALARKVVGQDALESELKEQIALAAGGLDRVTGEMQSAVMRTRLQPLDKLFGRYPRLIRDLAGKTGKKIDLVIEGGDTEVDKSVIEELGDPLVHLLRNSADHGLEPPDERLAAGKDDTGKITLRASHEGSHVRILVIDNGRGLNRARIGQKAVERGMVTEAELATLPDREVFAFIFGAGFSTADKVSDLSGRGVGMDVVRTNIQKIKGEIDLSSELGKGTTIAITIPLTVAILPAMLVGVDDEIYAVPLNNVVEIVKPTSDQLATIGEHPVMKLRNTVLPLILATDVFGNKSLNGKKSEMPFALVLTLNDKRMGLMVSRLIGQQEVVVKPLDELGQTKKRAVSGATVRDDGGVSLIVDVSELVRMAETIPTRKAA